MIGHPYGYGPCRLVALPLRRRVLPMRRFPRVRLAFRFGDPGFGAMPPVSPAPGQQVVYDGLGNPLGIFPAIPAIAAIAAKVLPIAAKALPLITKALPTITQAASALPALIPQVASALPALMPLPAPTPGVPAPPTVPSPTVQVVTPRAALRIRPPQACLPPTMEECRRLYPPPPITRRRRIVMRVRR